MQRRREVNAASELNRQVRRHVQTRDRRLHNLNGKTHLGMLPKIRPQFEHSQLMGEKRQHEIPDEPDPKAKDREPRKAKRYIWISTHIWTISRKQILPS